MNSSNTEFLHHAFGWLCLELNRIYSWYMETYELESAHSLGLPSKEEDVCKDISHIMWINHVREVEILRLDFHTALFDLRAKCLLNQTTKESFISIVDFQIHKIQLRGGGFGSRILHAICDLNKMQTREQFGAEFQISINAFKYLSLPFQLKNDMEFKWMVDNNDGADNDWNTTYKFFKLLILMNRYQDLNQYIQNFELFSMSATSVNDLLSRQIYGFYSHKYNTNLWIKSKVLDHVATTCCGDFRAKSLDFLTKVIYKNVINQLANDRLVELGMMNILQELFYLETKSA